MIKNKHNFIVKMLCIGYLIVSLSGCGNSGPQQDGTGEPPPGGATWEDAEFPYQEGSMKISDNSTKVDPPVFFNGTDGLIQVEYFYSANNEHYSLFYHTSDGGKSWTRKDEKIVYNDIGSLKYSSLRIRIMDGLLQTIRIL